MHLLGPSTARFTITNDNCNDLTLKPWGLLPISQFPKADNALDNHFTSKQLDFLRGLI
jgi:hypothetical protein